MRAWLLGLILLLGCSQVEPVAESSQEPDDKPPRTVMKVEPIKQEEWVDSEWHEVDGGS